MAQSLDQDRRDALQSIVNALSIQARGESDSGIRYALYWAIAIVRRELDYD